MIILLCAMKKMLLLILALLFAGQVFADSPLNRGVDGTIILNPTKIGHLDHSIPFDQPDVYLDTSDAVIIIDDLTALINRLVYNQGLSQDELNEILNGGQTS